MINSMFTLRVRVTISMLRRSVDNKPEQGLAAIRVQSHTIWNFNSVPSVFGLKREGDDVTFDVPNVALFKEWGAKYAGDPHGEGGGSYDFQFAGVFQAWRWLMAADRAALRSGVPTEISKAVQRLSAPAKRRPGFRVRHAVKDGQYEWAGVYVVVAYDPNRSWIWADLPAIG